MFLAVFQIGVFGFLIGAQIFLRSYFVRFIRKIFYATAAVIFLLLCTDSVRQYFLWRGEGPGKFLLPPYQPLSYFLSYVFFRFWAPWLVALGFALLLAYLADYYNKKFEGRFFEDEEPAALALSIFLTGYPAFLFYIISILFFTVFISLFYTMFRKGRAPLYYLWFPTAIFAILIVSWTFPKALLAQFNF